MNVAAVFVWFSLVVTKAICTLEEYRLVCYVNSRNQHHPDMLAFSLDMADPFLCTHIIMAYMDLDQDYHITPFTQEDKTLCNSLNMLKEEPRSENSACCWGKELYGHQAPKNVL